MKIGTLTTGAGVDTLITRRGVPAFILIGAVDTDVPLTNLNVTIGGDVTIKISGQTHIQAFAKYLMENLSGADVKIGMLLKVANDFIADQNLELVLTNAGVTTPDVFGFSEGKTDAQPVAAGQQTIQADDSVFYAGNFTALFFPDTNFDYAQIEFADGGFSDKLTGAEIDALFALKNQCDADGRLAGLHVIDNKDSSIVGVTLYTDNGGTLTITQMNIL